MGGTLALEEYRLCQHVGTPERVAKFARCENCQKQVDERFDEVWRGLLYPNGELDIEEMKGNLIDFDFLIEQTVAVYSHVTGGRISKTNTCAEAVISEADAHYERLARDEIADRTEEISGKYKKLVERGFEGDKTLFAAKIVADILCRIALGQVVRFVEIMAQAFPNLQKDEMSRLAVFFWHVAQYYDKKSRSDAEPDTTAMPRQQIRPYSEEFHDLVRVFSVLACKAEDCGKRDCWETRSWGCSSDTFSPVIAEMGGIRKKVCRLDSCEHKGEEQPITNFYESGQFADNYDNVCKDCRRKQALKNKMRRNNNVNKEN